MKILNIGVNDGHTIRGFGTGAVGRIVEGEHTRLVGEECRRLIKEAGHNAINCTVDFASSVTESLSKIMDQANRQDLDMFVSIHFNAGGGEGVEAYTYEGRQFKDALDVCSNIAKLGFNNRGVKNGSGLYVIKRTVAKSILIEVCFVDTADANHYLQVGYKAIAKAITDALIVGSPMDTVVTPAPISNVDPIFKDLQHKLNILKIRDENGNRLDEDGFPGAHTTFAIKRFQTIMALLQDGVPGTNTMKAINSILARPQCFINSKPESKVTRYIQYRIGAGIDGDWGTETDTLVRRFQASFGLFADGIVGKNTWAALLR